MSDIHAPQGHTPQHPVAPKKMTTFLKVSIILLIGLTLASISLLFIGDFEGRFERVFSTFALFAVFVVLTAIDTGRGKQNEWYAPVALIANTYILGLLLIVIWMTQYGAFSLMFEIIWKSILVIVVTRLVIVCCEVLLKSGEKTGGASIIFSFVTSVLAVISGILFTAPVGIEAFSLHIPDMYWKISTSMLILTALGLSITLLLRWSGKADARAARREQIAAGQPGWQQGGQPYVAGTVPPYGGAALPAMPTIPQQSVPQQSNPQQSAVPGFPQQEMPQQAMPQQSAVDQPPLLPWPTFADGRPLPAGPDGQPDFSVPGAPRPPHQDPQPPQV